MRRDPGNVEQRRSRVDIDDSRSRLAGIVEGLVIVYPLANEFDDRTREGNGVKEARIPEVHSREGRRRLRLRTSAKEVYEREHNHRGG